MSNMAFIYLSSFAAFQVSLVRSHSVAVCNVVAADGASVKLFAATYHEDETVVGGALLTDPKGVLVRYDFDGWELDQNESPALSAYLYLCLYVYVYLYLYPQILLQ